MHFPAFVSNYIIPAYIQTYDYSNDIVYCEGIAYFQDEVFLPITDNMVHSIKLYYYISNYGRVYSSYYNRILRQCLDKDGYCTIMLTINDKKRLKKVHRLVLMAFNPILNPEDFQVNHKNGCRYNNCLYNLEWVTPKENNKHSINYLRQDSDIMYLNINQAYEIGRMIKENQLTAKQIAEVFGCSENQVYAIHQGISFREVYDYYQLYNINMGLKCRRYEDKVAKVKEMLHNNIPIYRIAKELGISRSVVYSIRDGESYRGEYEYNV